MEVAHLATKLRLDSSSIAAALLHDTVEDTDASLDHIRTDFNEDVADIVDGLTKLNQVNFSSRVEAQSENFRKMLLAMAKDIRVLMLKLCDRTHNMRTLEFLSESRRTRISQETLDIYAPLAHRLGIYWMKSELEDLSLRYIKPEVYQNIKEHISSTKKERNLYTKEVISMVTKELEKNNISAKVTGRAKHFYSIFHKMERQDIEIDEIYDLTGFRILVDSTMECYASLGIIHSTWKPIPGRFKDYIAMPKPNQYQSLHSTVIGPQGQHIEFQIRTREMHEVAERGIAAHWKYKESKSGPPSGQDSYEFPWLKDLIESEKLLSDPFEFLLSVKEDLYSDEVFVFSPKGDLIALPQESTPIDFAYHIHSEVGNHCAGARVSGKQVPLSYHLQNGDSVEIITSDNQTPSKDWLNIVVTTKAKQRIRSWIRSKERDRSIDIGKELLSKDLRKLKLSFGKVSKDGSLNQAALDLGFKDYRLMLAELGYGKLMSKAVVAKLVPEIDNLEERLNREDSALQKIFQRAAKAFRDSTSVKVNGLDDVIFRFAKCCEPLPGDELVGFITRGRGVTIHTRGCSQTLNSDPHRLVPVTWDDNVKTVRPIKLKVFCQDKVGMLASMTQSISSVGANIISANVGRTENGKATCNFEVNIESARQLKIVRRKLESVAGVIRVERTKR
jgi:GTP pyrophosphokinase